MTNMGAPSARFHEIPEYALSGAILSIDLTHSASEPTRSRRSTTRRARVPDDAGDPFGGAGGRTRRSWYRVGPFSSARHGLPQSVRRPAFAKGLLYTIDNGPNWFLGDSPRVVDGRCTNAPNEGGRYGPDVLYVVDEGRYFGHPNPTRSSKAVTFNVTNPQSPIDRPRPHECGYTRDNPRNALVVFDTVDERPRGVHGVELRRRASGDLVAASLRSAASIGSSSTNRVGRSLAHRAARRDSTGFRSTSRRSRTMAHFPERSGPPTGLGRPRRPRACDRRSGAHWERLAPSSFAQAGGLVGPRGRPLLSRRRGPSSRSVRPADRHVAGRRPAPRAARPHPGRRRRRAYLLHRRS